jgi:hypothetical protein
VATATDDTDPSPTVTFADVLTPGTCPQNYTIARTWMATDDSGNSASATQAITVQDTTPPVLTAPTDITINSGDPTDPSATGQATATDSAGTVTITYADSQAGNVITRTWTATDGCENSASATQTITINQAPTCSIATPSVDFLWPPQHQMVDGISIVGVSDPEGSPMTIVITSVFQDEPTSGTGDGDAAPDALGVGGATISLRAERAGDGNGRIYHLSFTATDPGGASCSGEVQIGVNHDQGKRGGAVDDGANYDSTQP